MTETYFLDVAFFLGGAVVGVAIVALAKASTRRLR